MRRYFALALLVSLAFAQSESAPLYTVTAVRSWSLDDVTRIAIEVTGNFHLRSDRLHNPERVYFDIVGARPRIESRRVFVREINDRLVYRVRVAETNPGTTRVVLDLANTVEVTTSQLTNPSRLIVELRYGKPNPAATEPPAPSPLTTSRAEPKREPKVEPIPEIRPAAKPELAVTADASQKAESKRAVEAPPQTQRSVRSTAATHTTAETAAARTQAEPSPGSAPGSKVETRPLPKLESAVKPEPRIESDAAGSRRNSRTPPSAQARPELASAEPPAKPELNREPDATTKPRISSRTQPATQTKTDAATVEPPTRGPAPKPQPATSADSTAKPETKREPEATPKPRNSPRTQPSTQAKTESAAVEPPSTTPAPKPQPVASTDTTAKPELKSEPEAMPKSRRTPPSQRATQPKVESAAVEPIAPAPSTKTEAKSESKTEPKSDADAVAPANRLPRSQPVGRSKTESATLTVPPDPKPESELKAESKPEPAISSAEFGRAAKRTSTGGNSLTRALGLKIGRIVIDAGHGGHDQGTHGPHGLLEKDVVLDIAQRVGKLIEEKMGAEVVYTRNDDTFVPLEGRTEIANERKADLFLSIHANSSPYPRISGVETYYLNFTDSKDALDVASRENASSQKSVFELQDIIQKISLHEKLDESREFANRVQASLWAFSSRNIPGERNRGVKKAPFVVLIGANMPSVLAEIGFLSNPKEEAMLKKIDYRQKLAESLYRGLSKYAESLSHFQGSAN